MALFAISDPHLSLGSDKPMDLFGGNWENHTERLAANWRSVVQPEDTVLVGGDLSWGLTLEEAKPDLDFLAALPGRKLYVKGNHDLWWNGIKKLNSLYESVHFIQNDAVLAEGSIICGTRGWICPGDSEWTAHDQKIYDRELIRMELSLQAGARLQKEWAQTHGPEEPAPTLLVIMHYPPFTDKSGKTGFTDLLQQYGVNSVLYGHLHGEIAQNKAIRGMQEGINYLLISRDYLNCMPKRIL